MTAELQKEIIIGIVAAIFTGIPTVFLVWWTWARDRERLVVQKVFHNLKSAYSAEEECDGRTGILIRNRSLFPVRISSVAFRVDGGTEIELESRLTRTNFVGNERTQSDHECEQQELPSQAVGRVLLGKNENDRKRFSPAILTAKNNRKSPEEEILTSSRVVAIVRTEAGSMFTSRRRLEEIKMALNRKVVIATAVVACALFAWLVWPTLYSYRNYKPDEMTYLLRFHRISSKVDKLTASGWEPMQPYDSPASSDVTRAVPLDQLRRTNPSPIDITAGLVPKPEYIHPCPTPQTVRDVPPPSDFATSQCVSMLAPDRKDIVEIQVERERKAAEAGFELALIKPKK